MILWSAKCKRNLAKCVEKKNQKLHAVHLMYSHNHISKMIFPSTLGIVVGFHFIFSIILWCICDNTVWRCRAPYTSIKCERNFEKTGSSLKSFVVHFMHNAQHSTTQRHTHTSTAWWTSTSFPCAILRHCSAYQRVMTIIISL